MVEMDREFKKHHLRFAKALHVYLAQFPKTQKFSMAKNLSELSDKVFECVVLSALKLHKKTTLSELINTLYLLEFKIELARELGYFSYKRGGKSATLGIKRASVLLELLEPLSIRAKMLIKNAITAGQW